MRKILDFFDLGKIGAFELLFAMFPILMGYSVSGISGVFLFLILLDVWALFKPKKRHVSLRILIALIVYFIAHDVLLYFLVGSFHPHMLNNVIQLIVCTCSIFIIVPKLDYDKTVHSLMVVAIASSMGILYHYLQLQMGNTCSPIPLPFMPTMDDTSRLYETIYRPTSFFWEPAAYVTFMFVPVCIQMIKKRYMLCGLLIVFILLSTSSNGIILSAVLLLTYIFTQNINFKYKIYISLLLIIMTIFLLTSSIFEAGVTKIQNTDLESTSRIINGPILLFNCKLSELILGIPFPSIYEFVSDRSVTGLITKYDGSIFVSSFWSTFVRYGFIGVFLYIYNFYKIGKVDKTLMPYMICLIIATFNQSIAPYNPMFAFQMIVIMMIIYNNRLNKQVVKYNY